MADSDCYHSADPGCDEKLAGFAAEMAVPGAKVGRRVAMARLLPNRRVPRAPERPEAKTENIN